MTKKSMLIVFKLMVVANLACGVELYVAPDGNDGNPGTKEKPFASITRARDAIRRQRTDDGGLKEPMIVYLREGTHRLKETVVFGLEDSGTKESPITYAGYPGERAVFSAGVKITGWKKLKTFPE